MTSTFAWIDDKTPCINYSLFRWPYLARKPTINIALASFSEPNFVRFRVLDARLLMGSAIKKIKKRQSHLSVTSICGKTKGELRFFYFLLLLLLAPLLHEQQATIKHEVAGPKIANHIGSLKSRTLFAHCQRWRNFHFSVFLRIRNAAPKSTKNS